MEMTCYKVRCVLSIRGDKDFWLKRDVELPFPPTTDIEIEMGNWRCLPVEIHRDCEQSRFEVYAESDDELYIARLRRQDISADVTAERVAG